MGCTDTWLSRLPRLRDEDLPELPERAPRPAPRALDHHLPVRVLLGHFFERLKEALSMYQLLNHAMGANCQGERRTALE